MSDLAGYLLKSGTYLALFYAFYWLVLRRETLFAINRAYLLGAAVFSLVLPIVRVTSPFLTSVVYASPFPTDPGPAAVAAPARSAGPLDILFLVYAAGAALLWNLTEARSTLTLRFKSTRRAVMVAALDIALVEQL